MIDIKAFVALLRRALKSHYTEFLLNNRMLVQCYSIDEDSDIGLHYILHIPSTEEYSDSFYDETLLLDAKTLSTLYSDGHKEYLSKKKESGAKAKECHEEVMFVKYKHSSKIKYLYYVQDSLITTRELEIPYPINENDHQVENILSTITNIATRIRPNGYGIAFDAGQMNLYQTALDSEEIYYLKIKCNGRKIKIPMFKSLFAGNKEWREFFISVQETTIPMVYVYAVQFTTKGLTDQYVGYIQNF